VPVVLPMAQVLRLVCSVMVVSLMVPPNPQAVVVPAELAASALPMMPPVLTFAAGISSP
jgi:hypothetical protein